MTVGMTNLRRITGSWSFGRQKADVKELDWFSRKDLCLTAERDFGPVVPAPLLHHLFAYRDLNKLSLKQEIPLGKKYNQSKSGTWGNNCLHSSCVSVVREPTDEVEAKEPEVSVRPLWWSVAGFAAVMPAFSSRQALLFSKGVCWFPCRATVQVSLLPLGQSRPQPSPSSTPPLAPLTVALPALGPFWLRQPLCSWQALSCTKQFPIPQWMGSCSIFASLLGVSDRALSIHTVPSITLVI